LGGALGSFTILHRRRPSWDCFGVLAAEFGLDIFTAVAFSMAVIAGAAQFTALSLM